MAVWTVHGDGRRLNDGEAVRPDERLNWPLTIGLGAQHVAAMFGATVLVPALTGFPASTTLLFSGVGTLLFVVITRNRVPAYLGSSIAFAAPLMAAKAQGPAAQLGGVLLAGILVVVVGVAVKALGIRLLDSLMPPMVTGGVVLLVALNLASVATHGITAQPVIAAITLVVTAVCTVVSNGLLARISVLVGLLTGWLAAAVSGQLDTAALAAVRTADWIGLPVLQQPQMRPSLVPFVLPAVIVLVAQTVGYVKAIAAVTGRELDCTTGDALIASGLATMLAGSAGGSATAIYGQNVGVMAVTRVYSTAAYVVAALGSVALSFSPKLTAVLATLPTGAFGSAALVLLGLVAMIGVRIWFDNKIDLRDPVNLVVAGTAVVAGAGDLTVTFGVMRFGGVVWGSLLIVLGYPILRALRALRRTPPPTVRA